MQPLWRTWICDQKRWLRLLQQQLLEEFLTGYFADTMPPVDNPAVLARLQQKGELGAKKITHLPIPALFLGCADYGSAGQQMTELAELQRQLV